MEYQMEVLGIREIFLEGNVRALIDVMVNGVEIREFRVIQPPGKDAFVVVPQRGKRNEKTGKVEFFNLVSMPPKIMQAVKEMVFNFYLGGNWNERTAKSERV